MRKLLLLACLITGTLSMNAQEISEDQWSLVTKKTADWCTFCGQWGWTFKKNIIADQANKPTVVWSSHFSGGLKTPTSEAIINNFPQSGGQPVFFINNDNMNVFSSNIAAKREEFNSVLETLASLPAFAGVGSTAVFDGTKITNTAKVKFFVDLEADSGGGEYWLASYLVDDVLIAFQQSQGNNAEHQNVLLHSFNGNNYFGENIVNGSVTANQEFTVEGELDFSGDTNIPDYADGYSVVTILWSRVGDNLTPFNLNQQSISASTSTNDVLENISIAAFHLGTGQVELNVTSDKTMSDVTINLFDINGRIISTKSNVSILEGDNQVILDAQNLTLGTYIVNIQSELGNKSLKVSVR
jgi:flagellar hook assembly protein FlgD